MAQPGSAAAFGQKAFMARNCTDGDAVRSSRLMGTVTGPGGGDGGADIGGYGARRTSGETGGESGTGSGEVEGGSVTILQLYAATEVPPEGVGRTASVSTRFGHLSPPS